MLYLSIQAVKERAFVLKLSTRGSKSGDSESLATWETDLYTPQMLGGCCPICSSVPALYEHVWPKGPKSLYSGAAYFQHWRCVTVTLPLLWCHILRDHCLMVSVFGERGQVSQAILQFHAIGQFKSQCSKRKGSKDQFLCFGGGRYDRKRTLVILIRNDSC